MEKRRNDPRIFLVLTVLIQGILFICLFLFLYQRNWANVALTLIVIVLVIVPAFILKRYRVEIPPDFQLVAAAFVFLSLFMGSVAQFYHRFWWWDTALHLTSGFLLGIVGWLTLFLMNKTDRIPEGIRPGFLCFFAITFSSFLGVLWEIFEYAVDLISPAMNMQRRETGVVDTMKDLIANLVGATIIALMGWAHIKTGRYSFIVSSIEDFMQRNPGLFKAKKIRR